VFRKELLATGAGLATALALGAAAGSTAAFAQQSRSDADLYEVRGRIAGMLNQLTDLRTDYGGSRVTAMTQLQAAQANLTAAINLRGANQRVSDAVLRTVQGELQTLILRLQNDASDYGGSKVNAITNLQAAQASITTALGTA